MRVPELGLFFANPRYIKFQLLQQLDEAYLATFSVLPSSGSS